jgi:hypothetical protein
MSSNGNQGSGSKSGQVAQFPPLPPIPAAPQTPPDERQRTAGRVMGNLADAVASQMHVAGPNLSTGYHASAVNLGELQSTLAKSISRLNSEQLADRWSEVFDWLQRTLRVWVQRCKQMKIERNELGIHIELETQDDHGYYRYSFDVFPKSG